MIDLLQWPGMAFGLAGSPFVASRTARWRRVGFALWLVSNACWIVWAINCQAWGLLAMQTVFCATSTLGLVNNRKE